MPIPLSELQAPLTVDQARDAILAQLDAAGFPVTAWQDSGAARSFVEAQAAMAASASASIAAVAAQSFLSSAEDDYLTALASSHYDEARNPGVRAVLTMLLSNSSGSNITVAAEEIVLSAANGQTFVNVAGFTINNGISDEAHDFRSEQADSDANIPAQELTLVTPFAGLTAEYAGTAVTIAADEESDASLRERCRTKWGTLRVTKIRDGLTNLARAAAPAVVSVGIDDQNPRGPGTVDVYLAGENATAGSGDVATVQAAIDQAFFGQTSGNDGPLIICYPAPTHLVDLVAAVYYSGDSNTILAAAQSAFAALVASTPIGGFDFSPGPSNVILLAQILAALQAVPGVVSAQVTDPGVSGETIAAGAKAIVGTVTITMIAVPT